MEITIKPNRVVESFEGESIMEVLVRNQIPVQNVCSGKGTCGKCKVRFLSELPDPTQTELKHLTSQEIEAGFRLACAVQAVDGMEIEVVFAETFDRKETVLLNRLNVTLDHGLKKVRVQVPMPSLKDERGDWDRLHHELLEILDLKTVSIKMFAIDKLPKVLRAEGFTVTVTLWDNEVLDLEAGDTTKMLFGIAAGQTHLNTLLIAVCEAFIDKKILVKESKKD